MRLAATAPRPSPTGFTLVEIMFSVAISAMISAGLVALMLSMARTNQNSHSQLLMRQEAARVMNRLEGLIRHGSRDAGLAITDLSGPNDRTGRHIRFRRLSGTSTTSTLTTEIWFDADAETLVADIDAMDDSDPVEVLSQRPATDTRNYRAHVSDLVFSVPHDPNAANRALSNGVTVEMTMTDRGNTDRARRGAGQQRTLTIVRNLVLRAP